MSDISVFSHHAMTTNWEVRIAGEDPGYAEQAAAAAFQWADRIEALLSRFREESEFSAISRLAPGGKLKLSEPVFSCLALARECEDLTGGAFSLGATAIRQGLPPPAWSLDHSAHEITVGAANCLLDAGAIGKGFALDRMAEELADWEVASFLLVSGGSSVLAGDPPPGAPGWKAGIGDGPHRREFFLCRAGFGASGFAVKGDHITDPRTGNPATFHVRTWALARSAAQADALSTAWMCLPSSQIQDICGSDSLRGAALLSDEGKLILFGAMKNLPHAQNC